MQRDLWFEDFAVGQIYGSGRQRIEADRMKAFARVARSVRVRATVPVERITLFESTLAPSGARYRRLHSAILGGR